MIVEETDLNKKAEMLSVFAYKEVFPLNHDIIIEYSKSSNEKLKETSLNVLTSLRSELVEKYAVDLLKEDYNNESAIQMLIINYKPKYKECLLSILNSLKVDYNEDIWHAVGIKIIDAYEQNIRLPKEVYMYVYNNTLCSCCRYEIVRILAKHKWLSKDIIEECRYDSNLDIVKYINRYY